MVVKYLCSCLLCKNQLTTNQLKIHYGSKQCKSGVLFSQEIKNKVEKFKASGNKCSFCDFVGKNANSVSQHESLCNNNPTRISKNPSCGMKGKKGSNQFIKADTLGLKKPVVSERTRQLIRDANIKNPRSSYASIESQNVILRILEQFPNAQNVYFHDNGREYFLKDKNQIFFYDLVFLDIRYIVEYQGVAYHPKSLTENFRVPFESMGTKEEVWYRDRTKEQLAINNGFKIRYIWSDNIENDIELVINELKNILVSS